MLLLQVQGVQVGPGYPWWLLALHYIWQFGILSLIVYGIYRLLRYAFKHSGWFSKPGENPPTV
ncbi:hypothetical protein QNI19_17670 [Cytophagaceae bacterium DM2B3-1]|uniref:Uncharacterized protein n=1 Tax=Xanthocytophaga flava TaxID=3048013 RepID=A0ABT7CM61_9BACT|nr:hypothetical protein [Xanthocytophaga flavus]MDJ1494772.1 hypothetical protein [Xanthocytophaga flavus]